MQLWASRSAFYPVVVVVVVVVLVVVVVVVVAEWGLIGGQPPNASGAFWGTPVVFVGAWIGGLFQC